MELNHNTRSKKVIIIGAGPAGLTAAYKLKQSGIKTEVIEKDDIVGGISRTVDYKGYKFDIGGHRFFTKVKAVEDIWKEILGEDFLKRDRLSRIYYKNKFFYYPFKPTNAFLGLGLINSFLIILSYVKSQLFPINPELSFEDWITNRFGHRLYRVFFKTYTEKVWGVSCTKISADWAAQRIKGLSLFSALKSAFLNKNTNSNGVIKTLINSFYYPVYGPGMMWEKLKNNIEEDGNHKVHMNSVVNKIHWSGNKVGSVKVKTDGFEEIHFWGTDFISSMPIKELVAKLEPEPPKEILEASRKLNYRDFITVALIINKKEIFKDNWIYIHDPDVKVGRIQNFKNWSPSMVPDPSTTCLGLEYFCFEDDGLWNMSDNDLLDIAKQEICKLGFADIDEIVDGTVVRMPKAYPVYDKEYQHSLDVVRNYLSRFDNLQLIGRNGMHKYNNQDHSMLTAMLAVRNILGDNHDLWQVNTDMDYHEEQNLSADSKEYSLTKLSSTQPMVPSQLSPSASSSYIDKAIIRLFSRMDKFSFASSVGICSALFMFLGTIWLVLNGVKPYDKNFILLSNYFIGYEVSLKGAMIGSGYGLFWGFILGWSFAYLRNLTLGIIVYIEKKKLESRSFRNLLDYI